MMTLEKLAQMISETAIRNTPIDDAGKSIIKDYVYSELANWIQGKEISTRKSIIAAMALLQIRDKETKAAYDVLNILLTIALNMEELTRRFDVERTVFK